MFRFHFPSWNQSRPARRGSPLVVFGQLEYLLLLPHLMRLFGEDGARDEVERDRIAAMARSGRSDWTPGQDR
jgi:hypothetical protein